MGWTQEAPFQPDQKPCCFGFLPALVSLLSLCLMDEAQGLALPSNLCHLRQVTCLLWVTMTSEEHLAHDENLRVHSSLSSLQMLWAFKKFPSYDICPTYSHMRTPYTWLQTNSKQSLELCLTWLLCHCCQEGIEEEVGTEEGVGEQPGWEEPFLF